jgi:hypothetical protein
MASGTHRGEGKKGGGKSAASPSRGVSTRSVSTRSGSETRKRVPIIGFRATDEERATIEAAARRAGLTVGSYVRSRALKKPETRAVRRPHVETEQLAKLLGMLGVVGGTIARLTKRQSAEPGALADEPRVVEPLVAEPLAAELLAAVKDFRATAEAIILAMGKHPHLLHVTHHDH